MKVELIDFMGGDDRIQQAARVSTRGSESFEEPASAGFVDFLVRGRHSVPLEHSVFTFRIECPIDVSREIVKHRISSISEISARYTILPNNFYTPGPDRPLEQVGKTGDYKFIAGSDGLRDLVNHEFLASSIRQWESYNRMLEAGAAKEVARKILPVNIYTSMFMTMNARSLTNFISLRVRDETSAVPSFAMSEIDEVGRGVEEIFAEKMPLAYAAFVKNGRRAL